MNLVFTSANSRFVTLFVAPLILSAIYIFLIASYRYSSVSEVIVKDSAGFSPEDISLPSLLLGAPTAVADALQMRTYILSPSMLEKLEAEFALRAHFSSTKYDFWSRLDPEASQEEFLDYYRNRVTVEHLDTSGVTTIYVESYDPEYSKRIAAAILEEAEAFINGMGRKLATAQLAFLRAESERAAGELAQRRREVIAFQKANKIFNPLVEGEVIAQIQGGIEAELVKSRGKLQLLEGFLRDDAPDVVAARDEVRVLKHQLELEKSRLVNENDDGLNEVLARFQDQSMQFELATEAYAATLAGVEKAQFEAARQLKYLIKISGPTQPEEESYPDHVYLMGSAIAVLGLIYGIFSMLVTIIQEHAE